ncbi:unnamed protein product [Schistocephalus solidus]|uniref:Retrotransposon gag domain-containing protein n=1 Tax=Schistocephalus solidus TaxID=70667 RepID=A0A183T2D6_SCHSO|nr:unnamed protein product [Schistocephalus solidus]
MPWVARAALNNRRKYTGESVVDFQRHFHVLARQAYPKEHFTELEAKIFENFVDGISPRGKAPIPPRSPSSIKSLGVTKPLPPYRTLQSMSSPWDSERVATSALRQLNGSGALHSPPLLGKALHILLDAETRCNNVAVRPTLRLSQDFM